MGDYLQLIVHFISATAGNHLVRSSFGLVWNAARRVVGYGPFPTRSHEQNARTAFRILNYLAVKPISVGLENAPIRAYGLI